VGGENPWTTCQLFDNLKGGEREKEIRMNAPYLLNINFRVNATNVHMQKSPFPHSSKIFVHKERKEGRKEGRKEEAWGELTLVKNAQ
jgi:hypothetical protein